MGIDLSDLISGEPRILKDLRGKTIAIDGYNALYQFLSSIRQPDGTPLMNSSGRVTSHLQGILNRTVNLLEAGIRAVYVFDGKPHPLKARVLDERQQARDKAKEEWKKLIEEGDLERAKSKAQQSSRLTREMVEDAKTLLSHLGVPFVDAPSEGEAQASYMALKGDVWAAGSQDFDSLLFGAPTLVRNLTITGRRKMPRRQIWVDVQPECITLGNSLQKLGVTREQLVDMGILIGTDFNFGIKGIGPKKALKLVKDYGTLENIIREKRYAIPNYEDIRMIFMKPEVTDDYVIRWRQPTRENVIKMLCCEFEFSEDRVRTVLDRFDAVRENDAQKSLEQFL